jgi:SAM-dependent methyltransferase
MPYQSIDGDGDSDSSGKLSALLLPALKGKSFLDVGCNTGFFCGEALRRGATRVVGIDMNAECIEQAKSKFPAAEFFAQHWDRLPEGPFDVIIMLSALHYETRPKDLMRRFVERLSDTGRLILEIGVGLEPGKFWFQVERGVGTVSYPTEQLLLDDILSDFAVRRVGPSVAQKGDPLPRYVFHCTKRAPSFVFLRAPSGYGKSNIARSFGRTGADVLNLDQLLIRCSKQKFCNTPLYLSLRNEFDHRSINQWVDALEERKLADEAARFLFSSLPKEANAVIVEGYILSNNEVFRRLAKLLVKAGYRYWCGDADGGQDDS